MEQQQNVLSNTKLIRKRDKRLKEYDISHIRNAVWAAYKELGLEKEFQEQIGHIIVHVNGRIFSNEEEVIDIEEVQDYVVEALTKVNKEVAKAYSDYREQRTRARESKGVLFQNLNNLLNQSDEDILNENSNKNATIIPTQRDLISGEVSRYVTFNGILPKEIAEAEDKGILHWHDSDYSIQKGMTNCCLVNLKDMFANGTVINDKLVETPKSFETACTVATQIMAQIASSQYGGQSITIRHLAPYLKYTEAKAYNHYIEMIGDEELAKKLALDIKLKELKAGVQTIRYQLSTLQTTNGQAPFATIYLEIVEGDEFEEEEALICEEMVRQRLEGMKNEHGQEIGEAFPKLIYVLDEHNCLKGGKYDYITHLCAKCNVKRLVPDYQSAKIMRQNYEGNNFPAMGCRSHLAPWKDENGDYKFYGRFNQGVVSINLPQIGIIANGDFNKFWKLFDERLELCFRALMFRHEQLLGTKSDIAPILWRHGALARLKKGETIDKLLYGGYSSISLGYVGVYECVYAMMGVSHTTPEGEKFALEIMNYMKAKCDKWKKETNIGFSLYGSPAENLIYKFCKKDQEQFGIIENVTDKGFYTNSYHVDVREEIDAFSKLKFEAQFHSISSGGCISYVEVPDMSKNIEAVEEIIKFIYDNVQYAEINTKPDVCYKCGFRGEILWDEENDWHCPQCGNKDKTEMQVMRRTCGYIGTNYWNKGRTKEINNRALHL